MNSPEENSANQWRKATYSNGQGACVEVGHATMNIMIRDTKQTRLGSARTVLRVPNVVWQEFTAALKQNRL